MSFRDYLTIETNPWINHRFSLRHWYIFRWVILILMNLYMWYDDFTLLNVIILNIGVLIYGFCTAVYNVGITFKTIQYQQEMMLMERVRSIEEVEEEEYLKDVLEQNIPKDNKLN